MKVNPLTGQLETGGATMTQVNAAITAALAALHPVGELKWLFTDNVTEGPEGWLPLTGNTIGNVASGATFGGAPYEALFVWLWDRTTNSECPVSSGRGSTAATDFADNKTLTLPDFRARTMIVCDPGSATSRLTGATGGIGFGDILGFAGGLDIHSLTVDEMPSHYHAYDSGGGGGVDAPTLTGTGGSAAATYSTGGSAAHNNMPPGIIAGMVFIRF